MRSNLSMNSQGLVWTGGAIDDTGEVLGEASSCKSASNEVGVGILMLLWNADSEMLVGGKSHLGN